MGRHPAGVLRPGPDASTGAPPLPTIPIVFALASGPRAAARRALAGLEERGRLGNRIPGGSLVILGHQGATGEEQGAGVLALRSFREQTEPGGPIALVPAPRRGLLGRRGAAKRLVAVNLQEHGGRYPVVSFPQVVVTAAERWLVVGIQGPADLPATRPIAAVAAYAGSRERALARAARGGPEPGVWADLAAGAPISLVLLVGAADSHGVVLAIATPDLIAAELVWLVLNEGDDEGVGPWEDATVQRATELDLGARLPSQLEPHLAAASPTPQAVVVLKELIDRVRLRLGIPPSETSEAYASEVKPAK